MSPKLTTILSLSCEHSRDGFATPVSRPRLSWRFAGDAPDWVQKSYEIKIISSDGRIQEFSITSPESILQPWPGSPLNSGEKATVAVRAYGSDDVWTEWAELPIEATLLQPDDWSACMVSCHAQPTETSKRPFRVRKEFELDLVEGARLYITALGIYEVEVNGHRLDDTVFSPGWTSYGHRLRFETMDLSKYLHVGANCIGVYIGEGWYAGRLGYDGGVRNIYGTRLGVRAELWNQGEKVLVTDASWEWSYGPLITSEFYDGEVYDARLDDSVWTQDPGNSNADWSPVEVIPNTSVRLIPFDAPVVRKMETVEAKKILATPSGKVIVDFGQNLVGRIRFNVNPSTKPGNSIVLSHAEVLEHGELATRPLRVAKCQDTVIVGGTVLKGWEPRFTFHGFRYMQVDGWEGCQPSDFTAVVIHSDMERTGWFQCSHGLVNKLHENVVWSMKGNFLSVPTDCPQRDERLGWTGDLEVFTPTANYLYDTSGILSSWLRDLSLEHLSADGFVPPMVVPNVLMGGVVEVVALWGDVTVSVPFEVYRSFGDREVLVAQYESMKAWLDKAIPRAPNGLFKPYARQLGDWLDPISPPDNPGLSSTDPHFVANAYLVRSHRLVAEVAELLGHEEEANLYRAQYKTMRRTFRNEYVTPSGRPASDSETALALLIKFELMEEGEMEAVKRRLEWLVLRNKYQVATGFAGTPILLQALADADLLHLAYRMLQEKSCPSWLYPVLKGSTTIWERWNSMLEDDSINPGEMTSFNHYALGAVANFCHSYIGGISPLRPGWRRILFKPQPGGTITSANTSFLSPYGMVRCSWKIVDDQLTVDISIPPNCTGVVVLPELTEEVGSGSRQYKSGWKVDSRWPPKLPLRPNRAPPPDNFEDEPVPE